MAVRPQRRKRETIVSENTAETTEQPQSSDVTDAEVTPRQAGDSKPPVGSTDDPTNLTDDEAAEVAAPAQDEGKDETPLPAPVAKAEHRFRLIHEISTDGGVTWPHSDIGDYVSGIRLAEHVAKTLLSL